MLLKSEIGKRIEAGRKAAKLSQRELSERCGWAGQSRISMYERGEREPTFEDLRKIGKLIELDLTDLVPHAQQSAAPYHVETEGHRRLLRAFDLLKPDEQREQLSKIESAAVANVALERSTGPRLHSLDPVPTPANQRRRAK
jgi:transcriptional regulator with XRE-family HTH domain